MSVDYRSTVFLPNTDFPMRAGLAKREPEILAKWKEMDLYTQLREQSKDREMFVLHDGPPYANGHLHMGHALNKILKDVINRSHQMLGKNANYVPGWDCHGLPIEWKVEESYRAKGQDKDNVDQIEFRKECRDFADKWISVQVEEFQRLGGIGDWKNPYATMAFPAEAQIVREIGKFLMNGGLYAGSRPVLWSVPERTALADAEVEYYDHTSHTIWVRFPLVTPSKPELAGAAIVIWTTTPWTIPSNRAVAYAAEEDYLLVEVKAVAEKSFAKIGEKLLISKALKEQVCQDLKIEELAELGGYLGSDFEGSIAAHPLRGQDYDYDVPVLPADFVTVDAGTGFVHTAPSHGADDYQLGLQFGLEMTHNVGGDGKFLSHVPLFAGEAILTDEGKEGSANVSVIKALIAAEGLAAKGKVKHSYPHSWRSKSPLIFRNTPQWFISMETNDLRKKALSSLEETKFYPPKGQARLMSMIETRPDWCISRQRLWGVPLPIFVNKETGEPLRDQAVVDRVAQAFETEGGDAWFSSPADRWLGDDYNAGDYDQVMDVVEVWFDSGSTHAFVLEAREDLKWPADLYLEGSDQHRGWFHTSLLESTGTRGRAPYDAVLTHGFLMDEKGHKMSKSLGNGIDPQDVMNEQGADILRLWVVASDYSEDLRVGPGIIKQTADAYRRLRNTLRYLLGNLDGFTREEALPLDQMPELEQWVLHRLWELDSSVRNSIESYDFHALFRTLHDFCAVDLSAFYFDIRKDSLYCDAPDDITRRACRTVLDIIFDHLVTWLAPVISFTAEEAWWMRTAEANDGVAREESVHYRVFPPVSANWQNDDLAARWSKIRQLRRVVTGALELERKEKRIRSSLQAAPKVFVSDDSWAAAVDGLDLADICITSDIALLQESAPEGAFVLEDVSGVAVQVLAAGGDKCERCWKILPEVNEVAAVPDTCGRCAGVVGEQQAAE